MDGGGGPTSIIIRTPDQRVKDLQVNYEPAWTVANLKQKLAELYPGNPNENSQRLILAGKLLQDKTPLDELFKQYDYVPIIHFVCTQTTPESEATSVNPTTSRSSSSTPSVPDPLPNQPLHGNTRWSAHMSQLETWHQQLQANQAAVYHHHLTQAVRRHVENAQRENDTSEQQDGAPPADAPVAVAAQPAAGAMPPAAAAMPPAAAAMQQDPLEQDRHDILDIFYLMIRSMFLLALVWNYSSPTKFCFMSVGLFYLYLYQAGYITLPNFLSRESEDRSEGDGAANGQLSYLTVFKNVFVSFFTSLLPSNDVDNNLN